MPLTNLFKKYEESILSKVRISYRGLVLCELGNLSYAGKPAKQMYIKKGVQHTSIDINGKSGALPLNLDFLLPRTLHNKFDVITNYGTSEHVANQYSVFKNIHIIAKKGCIIIHGVPLIGNWPKHCRYHYSKRFFKNLAGACNYTIIGIHIFNKGLYRGNRNLIGCALYKNKSNAFISSKHFYELPGLEDNKSNIKTGNYTNK